MGLFFIDFPLLGISNCPINQGHDSSTQRRCRLKEGLKWIPLCHVLGQSCAGSVIAPIPRSTLAISIKASHSQSGLSGFQVLMPFGPAWEVAWVGHLQSHCLPALSQTGLWREGAAGACLGSVWPPLCCGELKGCGAALGGNQHLPHSSTPFCRIGGLSLRTVLARSTSLGASS